MQDVEDLLILTEPFIQQTFVDQFCSEGFSLLWQQVPVPLKDLDQEKIECIYLGLS